MRGQGYQIQVVELLDGSFSAEDVHRLPAHEMLQSALDLGGTALPVGTEPLGFSFLPYQGCSAVRTHLGEGRDAGPGLALGFLHAGNLGNDFPAFLHIHPVAFVDIQGANLVFVHQCGPFDHSAAQEHGLQIGHRGNGAGAAHLVINAQDGRAGLFGLEFIGNRPAGTLGGIAQVLLAVHLVDLNHNAVRGKGQFLAGGIPVFDKSLNLPNVGTDASMGRYGESPTLGRPEGFIVGREVHLAGGNVIEGAEEAPSAHFFGVLELERTAGGIAGIGKEGLLQGFPLLIETVKRLVGHKHLSADFELLGPAGSLQFPGDAGYLEGVAGYIVSLHAVSAGKGPEKDAVLIGEADGRSVEFEFAAIRERLVQRFGGPFCKLFHFFDGISVGKGQHRIFVRIFGKSSFGLFFQVRAYAAGGGVGRGELRILGLEVLQLVHQLVVLVVAHRGSVLYVVLPAVLPENSLELLNPMFCLGIVHTSPCTHTRV